MVDMVVTVTLVLAVTVDQVVVQEKVVLVVMQPISLVQLNKEILEDLVTPQDQILVAAAVVVLVVLVQMEQAQIVVVLGVDMEAVSSTNNIP